MAIFEITLLFLGSIIGAGFATGAEIVTFFGDLNLPIWLTALTIGLCILLIISLEIFLFHQNTIEITTYTTKPPIRVKLLHIVFVMIYLILFTTMTAGIIQITNTTTCLITLTISGYITLFGIKNLSKLNLYLVMIIIILIITTTLPYLSLKNISTTAPNQHALSRLLIHALIYAGLNCFMFPELISALSRNHKKHTLLIAAFITATLVTVLIGLILSIIQVTNTQSSTMPLLDATPSKATPIIVLLAIFTTQYTTLFALTQSIQKIIPQTKNKPLLTMVCLCLCGFIGSFLGFTHIIKIGYPLIGAFTCFYLLFSFLLKFWQLCQHRQP